MLVIRDSQIQSFIAKSDDDVLRLVCDAIVKANHGRVAAIRPLRLVSMVQLGIERAKSRGFARAEDIAIFVALMFEISPTFDTHPMISTALDDTNFSVSDRIVQLAERIPDVLWLEAEAGYDEKFWFNDEGK
ncbi:MAG TPA: hypothetical protein VK612_12475 [Pyrinomonadaceae bacterium]|nr:hypothetical protein [Pyrinomonadaceae bacterium]